MNWPNPSPTYEAQPDGMSVYKEDGLVHTKDPSGIISQLGRGIHTQALLDEEVVLTADEASVGILVLTGALEDDVSVVLPAPTDGRAYYLVVRNDCTEAFAVTITSSAEESTSVVVANAATAVLGVTAAGVFRITADVEQDA